MRRFAAYRAGALLLMVLTVAAGCARVEERTLFEGVYYPGKARGERADRRNFTATVRRASRGIEGAQQAVRHEARRYCLTNFGTSDIAWRGGTEAESSPVYERSGDRVSVQGRCVIWE